MHSSVYAMTRCPSVCLSQAGVLSKQIYSPSLFRQRLSSAYPTLCYKGIRASPENTSLWNRVPNCQLSRFFCFWATGTRRRSRRISVDSPSKNKFSLAAAKSWNNWKMLLTTEVTPDFYKWNLSFFLVPHAMSQTKFLVIWAYWCASCIGNPLLF